MSFLDGTRDIHRFTFPSSSYEDDLREWLFHYAPKQWAMRLGVHGSTADYEPVVILDNETIIALFKLTFGDKCIYHEINKSKLPSPQLKGNE